MLVFTRKLGQAIVLGDAVTIRVVKIGRNRIKLGIQSSHMVDVHREEKPARPAPQSRG